MDDLVFKHYSRVFGAIIQHENYDLEIYLLQKLIAAIFMSLYRNHSSGWRLILIYHEWPCCAAQFEEIARRMEQGQYLISHEALCVGEVDP